MGEDINGGLETDRDKNVNSCLHITPSIFIVIVR